MVVCANCGQGSEGDFAFCPHCGAQLPKSAAPREQRRTVTILFCDVTGSTALGESNDPEAFRSLLARYFERMNGIVETHGGIVGKFIGDAVMAVFGMPVAHEDDALRACRSALEMRDALPELGVQARIGINTGEVVSGIQGSLATGDAVNVAARLEQAAQPGEILIGAKMFALVGDTAEVEALEPLELKRQVEARAGVPAGRNHRIVRAAARKSLRRQRRGASSAETRMAEVLDGPRCELITVLGDAGAGKSRLTIEFLSRSELA